MKINLILAGVCGISALVLTAPASHAEGVKKVLFFSKSAGFEHDMIKENGGNPSKAQKVLEEIGGKNNFQFTFTKDGRVFTKENLAQYDAIFFYTTGDLVTPAGDGNPGMGAEGKAAFLAAIRSGKGFIGSHCASDTFHSPGNEEMGDARYMSDGDKADPYIKMLGGEFIVHGAQQKSHMIVEDPSFPGLKAVSADFGPNEEWYSLKNFSPDLHVILVQDTHGMRGGMYHREPYPATWAHMYGKGRVFYTNMGHREDVWTNPVFQSVLVGGINWAVGNVKADVTPNISKVTPHANDISLEMKQK